MAQAGQAHTAIMSGFVQSLQEPHSPFISPRKFSSAIGLPVTNLAALAGVHRNTLRNPASERLQSMMREMIKVIAKAAGLTGDLNKAIYWFLNEPIVDYDYKTAAELVSMGQLEAVMIFLRDLENGARG